MKIALAQTDVVWEDKLSNLSIAEAFIQQAAIEKVNLILFPELSFTGFSMNVKALGEDTNETIDMIKGLALKYKINIGFGYIQRFNESEKALNNYSIVSCSGEVLSTYTKIHPFSFGTENLHYLGGKNITNTKINNLNISTFICYDLRFPEIFQIASKTAELIIVAANWPEARKEHWITLLKARAIENQCYIAGINRVGVGDGIKYSGNSLIIDPLGNVISSCRDNLEGLIIGEIDLTLVNSVRESFKLKFDRKETLYYELYTKNS